MPEAGDPTYTLTNNGAGSFSLAVTIPGTSIAVDYTVDSTGVVTGATTSTTGATVAVDGHDLTITLADGQAVKVELGDAGDVVKEVSVENNNDNQETKDQNKNSMKGTETPDPQGADVPEASASAEPTQGAETPDAPEAPATAEPKASAEASDAPDAPVTAEPKVNTDSQDSGSHSSDSGHSSDGGSDSGN